MNLLDHTRREVVRLEVMMPSSEKPVWPLPRKNRICPEMQVDTSIALRTCSVLVVVDTGTDVYVPFTWFKAYLITSLRFPQTLDLVSVKHEGFRNVFDVLDVVLQVLADALGISFTFLRFGPPSCASPFLLFRLLLKRVMVCARNK